MAGARSDPPCEGRSGGVGCQQRKAGWVAYVAVAASSDTGNGEGTAGGPDSADP
jgi:hypothetical protein